MNIVHELRTDIGGTSRRTEELMGRAAAEIERLEAEVARLKEIEVKYDQFISGAFI